MQIRGYRMQREIARSDCATIHIAHHALRGAVAIKVVAPSLAADRAFRARFIDAAERARALDHPGIVRLHDVGVHGETLYVVMDYLRGGDLDHNLEVGLHVQNVLEVTKQMALALDYAHRKGALHLGVKPGNILFNAQGAARLADVGTSCALAPALSAFASPEQAQGAAPDARSDLYGLGVVFYRMLTGRLPFDEPSRPTGVAGGGRHRSEPPLALQWAPFRDVVRSFLAHSPADRFQSGLQVVDALEALRTRDLVPDVAIKTRAVAVAEIDAATVATDDDRGEGSGRRERRRWIVAWLVPVALAVVMAAAVGWQAHRNPATFDRALAAVGLVEHPDVVVAWREAELLRQEPDHRLPALVAAYRNVLALAPQHEGAASALAATVLRWQAMVREALADADVDLAATRLNELGAAFPDDAELATLFEALNDHRQAKRLLADTALLLAGGGLSHAASADLAIASYREALRLVPKNAEALTALDAIAKHYGAAAANAARGGDLQAAMENMERATAANPDFEGAEAVRATLSVAEALHAEINTLLNEAAELRERGALIDPPGDNAAERYRRVLATKPDDVVAVQGLAEVATQVRADFATMLASGDLEAARALVARTATSGIADDLVVEMNARYDDEIGRVQIVQQLIAEAEALCAEGYITGPSLDENCVAKLREAQQLDPGNADAVRLLSVSATQLETVAREAFHVGLKAEGLRYLDLALTITPGISRWRERRERWQAEIDRQTTTAPSTSLPRSTSSTPAATPESL